MLRVITCSNSFKYTYHDEQIIGSGYYACVYKGSDIQTNQDVAIKVVNKFPMKKRRKGSINGSDKEVLILQEIKQCENVINLLNISKDETYLYMITEYCEGGTLKQLLNRPENAKFKEKDALRFLYEIAKGVNILHQKGIMHRDLNLENIFFKEGRCVIGDFGSATSNTWSETSWAGTPEYRAPEVFKAREKFEYNKQADIWSLGIMFYEMLYGSKLYEGDLDSLMSIIEKNPYKVDKKGTISKESGELLKRMLENDPRKRIKIEELLQNKVFDEYRKYEEKSEILKEEQSSSPTSRSISKEKSTRKIFVKTLGLILFSVILAKLFWN